MLRIRQPGGFIGDVWQGTWPGRRTPGLWTVSGSAVVATSEYELQRARARAYYQNDAGRRERKNAHARATSKGRVRR